MRSSNLRWFGGRTRQARSSADGYQPPFLTPQPVLLLQIGPKTVETGPANGSYLMIALQNQSVRNRPYRSQLPFVFLDAEKTVGTKRP